MFKSYTNFVQPNTSCQEQESSLKQAATLSGEEAKRIYLNELKLAGVSKKRKHERNSKRDNLTSKINKTQVNQSLINAEVSNRDLYISVQNNDVNTLKQALDIRPDKINKVDDYGWSLLMIACQANSIEVVKELLERGIDTSVRDKAGNSAQSLIIKNKNYKLADTLLNYKNNRDLKHDNTKEQSNNSTINLEADNLTDFFCEICNINTTTTRNIHLSSTIHNINLSRDKKIPTNYVIPETNKGFQIMLKVGWDKESGLGPEGAGTKYPIKTVQKQDRKGLGHGKRKATTKETEETVKLSKRSIVKEIDINRRMEVNFRRQFY